jgi:pteridine reductase
MELAGRVVLVTGAARRVGAAIVRELAFAGARIAVHYHTSEADARALVDDLRARGVDVRAFAADLRDPAAIERLFLDIDQGFGGLDVLVSNASLFQRTPMEGVTLEDWHALLDVNLTAPFWCAKLAAPRMRARGGGVIIHMADVAGERGWPAYAPYSCAKAGLVMLTQVLAVELAPSIRVNAVAPGTVLWPDVIDDRTRDRILEKIPLKRIGTPEEVAKGVRFLIEQEFISGEVLRIDGARTARP